VKVGENRKIGAKSLNPRLLSPEKSSKHNPNPHGKNGNPTSLYPHSFDDALRKILKAGPPPKHEKPDPKKRKRAKK